MLVTYVHYIQHKYSLLYWRSGTGRWSDVRHCTAPQVCNIFLRVCTIHYIVYSICWGKSPESCSNAKKILVLVTSFKEYFYVRFTYRLTWTMPWIDCRQKPWWFMELFIIQYEASFSERSSLVFIWPVAIDSFPRKFSKSDVSQIINCKTINTKNYGNFNEPNSYLQGIHCVCPVEALSGRYTRF